MEIKELILRPWSVRFSLVLRDANRCVNSLAKRGALACEDLLVRHESLEGIAGLIT